MTQVYLLLEDIFLVGHPVVLLSTVNCKVSLITWQQIQSVCGRKLKVCRNIKSSYKLLFALTVDIPYSTNLFLELAYVQHIVFIKCTLAPIIIPEILLKGNFHGFKHLMVF